MATKTLHINKPSDALLRFVETLRENKERNRKKLISEKKRYFNK